MILLSMSRNNNNFQSNESYNNNNNNNSKVVHDSISSPQRTTPSCDTKKASTNKDSSFIIACYNVDGCIYHDCAGVPKSKVVEFLNLSTTSTRKGPRGGVPVPFPVRLHKVLDRQDDSDIMKIISWQSHGRSFRIHDHQKFLSIVLTKDFHQTKFTSFQRQLNFYGFQKVSASGLDHGTYYHELFVRGRSDLCSLMIRTKVSCKVVTKVVKYGAYHPRSSKPMKVGNFYDMPTCPPSQYMTSPTNSLNKSLTNLLHLRDRKDTDQTTVLPSFTSSSSDVPFKIMDQFFATRRSDPDNDHTATLTNLHSLQLNDSIGLMNESFLKECNNHQSELLVAESNQFDEMDLEAAATLLLDPYPGQGDMTNIFPFQDHLNEEMLQIEGDKDWCFNSLDLQLHRNDGQQQEDLFPSTNNYASTYTISAVEVDDNNTTITGSSFTTRRNSMSSQTNTMFHNLRPLCTPPKLPSAVIRSPKVEGLSYDGSTTSSGSE